MITYRDDWLTVHQGDCREVMAAMEPESVHCVVTSPPYWGLRDYGVEGGLGLEPTPEEYVANMVAVFREVRRVLRDDGTVWLNLGDSYAGGPSGSKGDTTGFRNGKTYEANFRGIKATGLKPKDLVGIPWRLAFALQADGWYLRSDIIWAKPNPMPESVTDRPTKAHEYVFLLSKSPRYWYDAEAVREAAEYGFRPTTGGNIFDRRGDAVGFGVDRDGTGRSSARTSGGDPSTGRNLRSVWSIATQPYPGAHFATFPEKLVEPCIKAGCPDRVCSECGAGWQREVKLGDRIQMAGRNGAPNQRDMPRSPGQPKISASSAFMTGSIPARVTVGWSPSCAHDAPTVPGVVLDPFAGSGTTGRVAQRLSRRAVLIDLNGEYLVQAMERNQQVPLTFTDPEPAESFTRDDYEPISMELA